MWNQCAINVQPICHNQFSISHFVSAAILAGIELIVLGMKYHVSHPEVGALPKSQSVAFRWFPFGLYWMGWLIKHQLINVDHQAQNLPTSNMNPVRKRIATGFPAVWKSFQMASLKKRPGEQGCAALANLALDEANRSHIAQKEGVNAEPRHVVCWKIDGNLIRQYILTVYILVLFRANCAFGNSFSWTVQTKNWPHVVNLRFFRVSETLLLFFGRAVFQPSNPFCHINRHVCQVLAGLRMHQNHPGIQAFGLGALGNLATAEDNCVAPWMQLWQAAWQPVTILRSQGSENCSKFK